MKHASENHAAFPNDLVCLHLHSFGSLDRYRMPAEAFDGNPCT